MLTFDGSDTKEELSTRKQALKAGWLSKKTDRQHQDNIDSISELLENTLSYYDIDEDFTELFVEEFGVRRSDDLQLIVDLYMQTSRGNWFVDEFFTAATYIMRSDVAFKLLCRLQSTEDIKLAFDTLYLCRRYEDAEEWLLAITLFIANGEKYIDLTEEELDSKTEKYQELIYKFSLNFENATKSLRQLESTMSFMMSVYGVDLMISVLEKVLSEDAALTVSDFRRLIANWDEINQYPAQWAINLTPSDLHHYIPESDINSYGSQWKEML